MKGGAVVVALGPAGGPEGILVGGDGGASSRTAQLTTRITSHLGDQTY